MDAPRSPDGPSLMLIVADTTRADAFASLDITEPSALEDADSLGRIYVRATSSAPWTAPAHASMFTGLDPGEHGIWRPNLFDAQGRPIPKIVRGEIAERWLPAKMKALGYRTLGISANPWVAPYFGMDHGFDRFVSLKDWAPRWASRSPSARIARRLPAGVTAALKRRRLAGKLRGIGPDAGAGRTLETMSEWLAESSAPSFVFLNFMEPHWPYRPPIGFEGFSSSDRRHAVDLLARLGQFKKFSIEAFLQRAKLPDRDRAMLRRLYEGEVHYLRSRLFEWIERMDDAGRLRDTVVVITSDHGEQLGEHGQYGHGSSLYEELLHVPLLVLGPDELVGRGVERQRVGTKSLYRAFETWARGERAELTDGPVLAEGEGMWYQPVVQRMRLTEQVAEGLKATTWAIYEGDRKYVRDGTGSEAVYDLATDPTESNGSASDERPGVVSEMRALMDRALAARRPAVVHGGDERSDEIDGEVEAQLRSLGYL